MLALLLRFWQLAAGIAIASIVWWLVLQNVKNDLEEKRVKDVAQAKIDQKEVEDKAKIPNTKANEYDKINSDNLLTECLASLQQQPECVPVYITRPAADTKTAYDYFPALRSADIAAHNLYCKKLNNDLNAAKVWGQEYLKWQNENK